MKECDDYQKLKWIGRERGEVYEFMKLLIINNKKKKKSSVIKVSSPSM